MFDPLGNAVHTALKFEVVGEVLITGAGPIGQMAPPWPTTPAPLHHHHRHLPQRLAMAGTAARTWCSTWPHPVRDAQRRLEMREGFDVAWRSPGTPGAQEMIENMNHGGKIALLGLPSHRFEIDWTMVVTRMITLQGIYGREMYETWNTMSAMLSTSQTLRAITRTITDVLPAAQWERGFEIAKAGCRGQVVLDWSTSTLTHPACPCSPVPAPRLT